MKRGIIATPHHLASEAGAAILRDGGNAVDAAVAANAVLCVVYPHMTTIGGDLFALVWPAGAAGPIGVEGAGWAGSRAQPDALRDRGLVEMPERGAVTVTVPGVVQGWGRLVERFGSLGLEPLLANAASLARDGFLVTENLAGALASEAHWLMRDRASAELFPPLKAGMLLRNPDLATALTSLGRNGFYGFYRGDIAHAIVETLASRGGLLTEDDMSSWRSDFVEPIEMRWRDLRVFEMPPPSQGVTMFGMLARLSREPEAMQPSPEAARELRRLRDAVYPLRDRYVSDPLFVDVPLAPFLDASFSAEQVAAHPAKGDTVYLCAADEDGNLVSLIQSVAYPFGSGIVVPGTGILLQNRGTYFSLDANDANCIAPRKRTMHTLMPAIAARDAERWAFGSMGGDGQPQLQFQVLMNLARGVAPQQAVDEPRVRVNAAGTQLAIEADYPDAADLARTAPGGMLMPPRHSSFGHAHAIVVDEHGWRGGADPRSDGSVIEVSV